MAILKLQERDANNRYRDRGSIEIKNKTESEADLCFYGDIVSESMGEWKRYYPDAKAPKDVQDFLEELEDVKRINIHINSGGGSVFGGITIYNILKRYNAEKIVYIDGLAASIASVIAMAGDKIIIPQNAQMMIHKPSSYTFGTADDMRKQADILDGCQKVILNTYMTHAKEGITQEQIDKLINEETWKNGEEWKEYFDVEVTESSTATACASTYFCDYKHLPENLQEKKEQLDVNKFANELIKRLEEKWENYTPSIKEKDEKKQIEAILEDLDYFI